MAIKGINTVLRYTPEVQKALGSKTKPEPWLHVAVTSSTLMGAAGFRRGSSANSETLSITYAIYVWDTRKVVEQDMTSIPLAKDGTRVDDANLKRLAELRKVAAANRANDNGALLDGADDVTKKYIEAVLFKKAHKAAKAPFKPKK